MECAPSVSESAVGESAGLMSPSQSWPRPQQFMRSLRTWAVRAALGW